MVTVISTLFFLFTGKVSLEVCNIGNMLKSIRSVFFFVFLLL